MRTIGIILKGLEGNVAEFKRLCEAGVCSPTLREDLSKALTQGSIISNDVDYIMEHLFGIKNQLERPVDNPE